MRTRIVLSLWRVDGPTLEPIAASPLDAEQRLEDRIAGDPSILGMDVLVIGRQVHTPYGGRIDLLALDTDANTVILELTRDRTVRFERAVYVLHAFQKKSPSGIRTAKRDVDLVAERMKTAERDYEERYDKPRR